jgi:hypothetical protein
MEVKRVSSETKQFCLYAVPPLSPPHSLSPLSLPMHVSCLYSFRSVSFTLSVPPFTSHSRCHLQHRSTAHIQLLNAVRRATRLIPGNTVSSVSPQRHAIHAASDATSGRHDCVKRIRVDATSSKQRAYICVYMRAIIHMRAYVRRFLHVFFCRRTSRLFGVAFTLTKSNATPSDLPRSATTATIASDTEFDAVAWHHNA